MCWWGWIWHLYIYFMIAFAKWATFRSRRRVNCYSMHLCFCMTSIVCVCVTNKKKRAENRMLFDAHCVRFIGIQLSIYSTIAHMLILDVRCAFIRRYCYLFVLFSSVYFNSAVYKRNTSLFCSLLFIFRSLSLVDTSNGVEIFCFFLCNSKRFVVNQIYQTSEREKFVSKSATKNANENIYIFHIYIHKWHAVIICLIPFRTPGERSGFALEITFSKTNCSPRNRCLNHLSWFFNIYIWLNKHQTEIEWRGKWSLSLLYIHTHFINQI